MDVNITDLQGMTALLWACRLSTAGCKDFFVEQLLAHPLIDLGHACSGRCALQVTLTLTLTLTLLPALVAVLCGSVWPSPSPSPNHNLTLALT